MSCAPVNVATLPAVSIIATCRTSQDASAPRRPRSASGADLPVRRRSSPSWPYDGSTKLCVATAPTPASAHGTICPTANQCDCTATPICPVCGSRATIENVLTGRNCANAEPAKRRTSSDFLTDHLREQCYVDSASASG